MANEVVRQVSDVLVGAYGAAQGACTSIGPCEELTLTPGLAVEYSENAAVLGARVGAYGHTPTLVAAFVGLTSVGATQLQYAVFAEANGNELQSDGGAGPLVEKTVYVTGVFADGLEHTLKLNKVVFASPSEWKQSRVQNKLTINAEVLYDTSAAAGQNFYLTTAGATDTTPPTISTVSPADAATAVSKAISTVVEWTFSEAIKVEDVTDEHFLVHQDDGTIKAGTVAFADAACTIVRFTPTAAWAASTKFHPTVIKGVRDLAGNKLAASSSTDFTSGA